MAKGDRVRVVARTGEGALDVTCTAMKAGRSVNWKSANRGKVPWLLVEEVTRFGRPTGNRLMVRMSEVIAVEEQVVDLPEPKKKPVVKVTIAEPGLWDAGEVDAAIAIGARAG